MTTLVSNVPKLSPEMFSLNDKTYTKSTQNHLFLFFLFDSVNLLKKNVAKNDMNEL